MLKFLGAIFLAPAAALLLASGPYCYTNGQLTDRGVPKMDQQCQNLVGISMFPAAFMGFILGAIVDSFHGPQN